MLKGSSWNICRTSIFILTIRVALLCLQNIEYFKSNLIKATYYVSPLLYTCRQTIKIIIYR